jgi:hypothetical protein
MLQAEPLAAGVSLSVDVAEAQEQFRNMWNSEGIIL